MRDGITGQFKLVPRNEAVVSVFDSNFLIGDGIWVRPDPSWAVEEGSC